MNDLFSGIADIFGATNATNQGNQDTAALNDLFSELQGASGGELKLGEGLEGGLGSAYGSLGSALGGGYAAPGSLGAEYSGAENFYNEEMTQGLDPAVRAAAMNTFNTGNEQTLANIKSSYTGPNAAGLIEDVNRQDLQGNEALQGQLAAQDQGIRQQGAAAGSELALGAAQGLGSFYGQTIGQAEQPVEYMSGVYGTAAQNAYNTANQDWQGAAQGIGGAIDGAVTGGFGSLFGGGGGGTPTGGSGGPGGLVGGASWADGNLTYLGVPTAGSQYSGGGQYGTQVGAGSQYAGGPYSYGNYGMGTPGSQYSTPIYNPWGMGSGYGMIPGQ